MVTNQRELQTHVPSKYCRQELSAPVRLAKCEGECEEVKWIYGRWSECSETCGGGDQSRPARCEDGEGHVLEDRNCEHLVKMSSRKCGQEDCAGWYAGQWSECSETCGRGVRQRAYSCQQAGKTVSSSLCGADPVPEHKEECRAEECMAWVAGEWTPCSAECGRGIRYRKVVCATEESKEHLTHEKCKADEKPKSSSSCIEKSCGGSENNEDNSVAVHEAGQGRSNGRKHNKQRNKTLQANSYHPAGRKYAGGRGPRLPRYRLGNGVSALTCVAASRLDILAATTE